MNKKKKTSTSFRKLAYMALLAAVLSVTVPGSVTRPIPGDDGYGSVAKPQSNKDYPDNYEL